ncbi:MAG: transposase, partial [Blastochloris sp.]|nr:transposase [Blastochloris sp.]
MRKRLLLCLYGLGTNTGLKRMAVGNPDVTYRDLLYVWHRFITADQLRQAIARVVNTTLAIRMAPIWGATTTTCASDAKKFGAWNQNLLTRELFVTPSLRYADPRQGMIPQEEWPQQRPHVCRMLGRSADAQ